MTSILIHARGMCIDHTILFILLWLSGFFVVGRSSAECTARGRTTKTEGVDTEST
jgi:hypothetical protein